MSSHFIECVLGGQKPMIDVREGAKTVAALVAGVESAESGKPVKVFNEFWLVDFPHDLKATYLLTGYMGKIENKDLLRKSTLNKADTKKSWLSLHRSNIIWPSILVGSAKLLKMISA